ncbi:hypothetical protein P7K49_012833 [Saguinus oedipus]|uniref:Uncharacterized protein n=1 Tax=Saguinus oedipus TaxID=9490 RepID=A0ABQ9VEA6_SAGOE|nr:hypothetical protein P7K49_012833 [Saguinus oedipus]
MHDGIRNKFSTQLGIAAAKPKLPSLWFQSKAMILDDKLKPLTGDLKAGAASDDRFQKLTPLLCYGGEEQGGPIPGTPDGAQETLLPQRSGHCEGSTNTTNLGWTSPADAPMTSDHFGLSATELFPLSSRRTVHNMYRAIAKEIMGTAHNNIIIVPGIVLRGKGRRQASESNCVQRLLSWPGILNKELSGAILGLLLPDHHIHTAPAVATGEVSQFPSGVQDLLEGWRTALQRPTSPETTTCSRRSSEPDLR